MKTHADPTKEHQHTPPQRTQKAPSATATLADHRPQTVHQRQLLTGIRQSSQVLQAKAMSEGINNSPRAQKDASLLASMQAHVEAKAAPVQRMAAKGSPRFRQIAAEMGTTYGVDTSGLKATHHSTFPARLKAEATIQGRNIHFAPGKDTDHNMRHEVAHAIDNTLNGTPKGDQVVNGQMVDTTREHVVHGMISDSRSAIQRNASSDPHVLSFSEGVFQLKPRPMPLDKEIDPNKLNVVGETHRESVESRKQEEAFAEEKFKAHKQEKSYWIEKEIGLEVVEGSIYYGDSPGLIYLQWLCFILLELDHLKEWNDPVEAVLSNVGKVKFRTRLNHLLKQLDEHIIQLDIALKDFKNEYKAAETFGESYLDDCRELYDKLKDRTKEIKELFPSTGSGWLKFSQSTSLGEKSAAMNGLIRDFFLNKCDSLIESKEDREKLAKTNYYWAYESHENSAIQDQKHDIVMRRSDHMQDFAQRNNTLKGVWKVGQAHIRQIQKIESDKLYNTRPYNLISKEVFNKSYEKWKKTQRLITDDTLLIINEEVYDEGKEGAVITLSVPKRERYFPVTTSKKAQRTKFRKVSICGQDCWIEASKIGSKAYDDKDWGLHYHTHHSYLKEENNTYVPKEGLEGIYDVGWKVYISSEIRHIPKVLAVVTRYLRKENIAHKIKGNWRVTVNINDIYRRLVTIYFREKDGDKSIVKHLKKLDGLLTGIGSPFFEDDIYTLGKSGKIHMRYGGSKLLKQPSENSDEFEIASEIINTDQGFSYQEIKLGPTLSSHCPFPEYKLALVNMGGSSCVGFVVDDVENEGHKYYLAYKKGNEIRCETGENPNDYDEKLPEGLKLQPNSNEVVFEKES